MDTIQILLLIVLCLSTIFLTIVGIQLVLVLIQLRKTLGHVNKIVTSFDTMGVGLQNGLGEIVGFVNGFKTIMKVIDISRRKNDTSK